MIGDTLHSFLNPADRTITLPDELPVDLAAVTKVTVSACGTAFHTPGWSPSTGSKVSPGCRWRADIASEFRYRAMDMPAGGVALFISQSGETADTLAALRYAKEQGQIGDLGGQCAGEHDRPGVGRGPADLWPARRSASPRPRRSPPS